MEKIKFSHEDVEDSKNEKLQKIMCTIKELKEIARDNDMQNEYVSIYWKKIWRYTKGAYITIDDNDYNELSEICEQIATLQTKLSFKLEIMIDKCLDKTEYI